ncbi:hypothetical protein [Bradyrhizobium sp. JYMT SZCCT0428]|uniref:hypothetical protein n=1 Tax=Bradyrhizobium sp. JYMT SZCCT0428 TaxID=2807673 RepID=UPI001BA9E0C5|nr:hypothetical protein [Bradyrhizobium sp. JYMT SZCCT0428]MBR1149379.1 hypothetical protein [Bradyrhizobium sp. JYMT SZCCT0428]
MSDDYSYPIDIDSIRRAFPPGTEAPPLLIDFAGWLKGRDWGNAGCYELVGDFSDNAPIVDGSPLRDQFALFARLPEGSVVGAWYGAGTSVANAPIVVLGSEGQYEIIAASLEGLLAKIAIQRFEEDVVWTDFTPHEDAEDETHELADWLAKRFRVRDLRSLTEPPTGLPDFGRWMEKWCRDREAFWETHPAMTRLADQLIAHRPPGKTPWDRTMFEVAIAGQQYQVRVLDRGRQPIEEVVAIEPLLRGLRDDMWRAKPDLGLWYSMSFSMGADGRILPRFDYETRPAINDVPVAIAEARTDLVRAPRPERWVPAWLST